MAGRIERVADNLGPQPLEPDSQPGALESGVPGNEDPAFFVTFIENHNSHLFVLRPMN